MEKKTRIIMIIGLVLLLGLAVFLLGQRKKNELISPIIPTKPQVKQEEKLLIYKDVAGFEFQYPESVIVKEVLADNLAVYSLLELSSKKLSGMMIIRVVDTSFNSLEAWLKSQEASGAGASREIILAGLPGQQIQFLGSQKLVTIVIDDGVMYFFESPLNREGPPVDGQNSWNKIHNQIVSSFNPLTEQSSNEKEEGMGEEEIIYEEEEIIE